MDLKSSEGDGSVTGNENADKPPENPNSDKKPLDENPNPEKEPLVENANPEKEPLVENVNPNSDKKPLDENLNPEKKPLVENANPDKKPLVDNGTEVGNKSEKYICADKIDLKQLDVILARRERGLSIETTPNTKKQEWEIDLAKLDLKTVVAHGTYGSVYRAVYDGQDVAVKVLDWGEDGAATAYETAELRSSFRKEVAVWHKLDHPNVTKFIGASMGTSNLTIPVNSSSNGGRDAKPSRACCVVVEYVSGGTLKEYLINNRKRKLSIKVVIQLALDLSRGLSYLHSKKIVHRDVKTENMLIDNKRTLKIADFGVARVEAQNPRDMTGETGTLRYMAPEVLDGKPYDRKCDVYSFGICLWETYCCAMPYDDANYSFAELSYAVVQKNFRPEIPRCCPATLANIMRKCWDANPNKRPNMDEVVKLLEAVDTTKGGGMVPDDQVVQSCFCFGPNRNR